MAKRQPALFIGHGSPTNAVADNSYTRELQTLGEKLRANKPKAAIVFSAHWETDDLYVLTAAAPRTIHDFYGFPRALFEVQYPALSSPTIAEQVLEALTDEGASSTHQWGFDHGVWSVMRHLFPKADLPIVMVSLARRLDPETHLRLGRKLRPLRDAGVMILGSGNIVHNLREIQMSKDPEAVIDPHDWAISFDARIKEAISMRDEAALIAAPRASDLASRRSVPTREHYLPLLPVIGASWPDENPRFFAEEIQNAAISMRSVAFGA